MIWGTRIDNRIGVFTMNYKVLGTLSLVYLIPEAVQGNHDKTIDQEV